MRRFLLAGLGVLALLAIGAALTAWRWTQTAHGTMDLGPALMLRLFPMETSHDFSAERRQEMNAQIRSLMPEAGPGVTVRDAEYPGPAGPQPLRIYAPEEDAEDPAAPAPLPMVVFIHGGGWWMGDDLANWDGQCAELARSVPARVISVGYRMAPEHPFPAALDDSYAALTWIHRHARELGGDPRKMALQGARAGGNLGAAVALRARDEGGPAVRFQVLTVPATRLAGPPSSSMRLFAQGFGLDGIDAMVAAYLGENGDPENPWASPLLAPDHRRLPPALILTAQFDPLRDDGEAYGARLRAAGVPAEVRRFDGTIHGFLFSPDAREEATALTVAALQQAFADPHWAPPYEPLPVLLR